MAGAFGELLEKLAAEHGREVEALRREVAQLKQALSSQGAGAGDPSEAPLDTLAAPMVPPNSDERHGSNKCNKQVKVPEAAVAAMEEGGGAKGETHKVVARNSSLLALQLNLVASEANPLKRFVRNHLEMIMSTIVLLNSLVLFLDLEFGGYEIAASTGLSVGDQVVGSQALPVIAVLEHVVNAVFVAEMVFKISILRSEFFYMHRRFQWFNTFDFSVVALASVDLYVLRSTTNWNGGAANVARLARFIRAARAVNYTKLRVLVQTFVGGLSALGWSMCLLGMFVFIGAICICQLVQGSIADGSLDPSIRKWAYDKYGTSSRACWTMFELTFSGGWPNYVQPLVEKVSGYYIIFFIVYVSFVIFAALRIATALLIRDTMAAAASDASLMVELEMQAKQKYANKLRDVFEMMDASGDGEVSKEEFQELCNMPQVVSILKLMDIHMSDVQSMFEILDDGDGKITFEEFLSGAHRIKGNPRAMDVVAIMHDTNRLYKKCCSIEDHCSNLAKSWSGASSASAIGAETMCIDREVPVMRPTKPTSTLTRKLSPAQQGEVHVL